MIGAQTRGARTRPPPFPGGGPIFVTPTREAALSVTRFAPVDVGDGMDVRMPREDAFVLVFQLGEHWAHDYWTRGRLEPAEASARGTIFVADLSADPRAQITKPCDKLVFHLPRAALDEIAEAAGAPRVPCLVAPLGWRTLDPVVAQVQGIIVNALAEPESRSRLFVDHLMLGLNAHFAYTYGGMRPRKEPRRGGLAPWQENRAKELLAANLSKEVSLEEIAGECGLALAHFSRAFKASTGTPPHAWLQMHRLKRAKGMLRVSAASLAEIVLTCGFADQSHFTRTFARSVGITPGKWRRLQK
jgi:AraC family transcriptional regulator